MERFKVRRMVLAAVAAGAVLSSTGCYVGIGVPGGYGGYRYESEYREVGHWDRCDSEHGVAKDRGYHRGWYKDR